MAPQHAEWIVVGAVAGNDLTRGIALDVPGRMPEGSLIGRVLTWAPRGINEVLDRCTRVPPRNYRPALTEDLARWAEGLGAWDALHRRGDELVRRVSSWMQRLGAGYRLE